MNIIIRPEQPADIDAIFQLTQRAFEHQAYSSHTEHLIVNALRRCHQLTLSLVAEEKNRVIGHAAISPVTLSSNVTRWYGLGPVAVRPDRQRAGIGSALIKASLDELQRLGGVGCVVLGDPAYYRRFGFTLHPGLVLPGVPEGYFQALALSGELPQGEVSYHPAFNATA